MEDGNNFIKNDMHELERNGRCNVIRLFAALDVTDKWNNAYKQTIIKKLSGGHIPFAFSFCQNKISILLFNISVKTVLYYIPPCGAKGFMLYKLNRNGDAICEQWVLKDKSRPYHIRRSPFVLNNSQKLGVELYMPYIEAANRIVANNLEAMMRDLHQSEEEIFQLADDGVGITPWYYRQRLYKGLFGELSIANNKE